MFIVSQIFGLVGLILVLIAMALKSHRKLLFYKLLSTVFILLSYFFVGSVAGVLISVVSLTRGIFALGFTYNDNLKLRKFSIYFLCVLTIILNIIFWKSGLNILAIIISLISIFCFFQRRVFYIRSLSILVSVLEIIVSIIVLNPINIIIELSTITSCVYGIAKHDVVIFKAKRVK